MKRNLGQTSLRRKRRKGNVMQSFDQLPKPLRHWLMDAALPWSLDSTKKIWKKSLNEGLSIDETLAKLSAMEERSLQRDKHAFKN